MLTIENTEVLGLEAAIRGIYSMDEFEAFYKKAKEFVKIKKCERTKRRKLKND